MKRLIFASKETELIAEKAQDNIVRVYSFFPVDKANCPCQILIKEWGQKLSKETVEGKKKIFSKTPHLICPRDKKNLQRFIVICSNCKEPQGYCYATDASLEDWCDFHYVQWTNGDFWRGCFTPHVSPITQKLLFECCCGQDIRDFRANMTLNQRQAEKIESKNVIGREFNKGNSKFVARKFVEKVVR